LFGVFYNPYKAARDKNRIANKLAAPPATS